jgi:hypothetical protein
VFALRPMVRGLTRTKETHVPDIRETLAQLDTRLADLRHQINNLVTEPEQAPPPPPLPGPSSVQLPTAAEIESAYAGQAEAGSESRGSRGSQAQMASEAVDQLGAQVKQLLTIRERLLNDAERLLAGYERQLRELESLDASAVEAALAALLPASGVTQTGAAAHPPESRPAFFDGVVTISVMGVHRIQTIQVLEDSLSRVRHVNGVYVRRWHAGQLLFELTLSAGVELIGELNRVLPFAFAVQSATGQEIAITLEGER